MMLLLSLFLCLGDPYLLRPPFVSGLFSFPVRYWQVLREAVTHLPHLPPLLFLALAARTLLLFCIFNSIFVRIFSPHRNSMSLYCSHSAAAIVTSSTYLVCLAVLSPIFCCPGTALFQPTSALPRAALFHFLKPRRPLCSFDFARSKHPYRIGSHLHSQDLGIKNVSSYI